MRLITCYTNTYIQHPYHSTWRWLLFLPFPKRFDIGGGAIAPSPLESEDHDGRYSEDSGKVEGYSLCWRVRVGGGVLEGYNCDGEKLIPSAPPPPPHPNVIVFSQCEGDSRL